MHTNRLQQIQKQIAKENFDALLVSSIPNITYLTNFSNFSSVEREAFLIITKNNAFVITDGRYIEAAKTYLPEFTLLERSHTTPLQKHLEDLKNKHKLELLGIETQDILVAEYMILKKIFKTKPAQMIEESRMVKDRDEIKKIERACKLGDKTFEYILQTIKIGMKETELANLIWIFIKQHHADISFSPIVCFGKTSSDIHHGPTDTTLTPNSIVLVDFGIKLNSYCSDMTRTFFVGKASEKQKKMYDTVLSAQTKAFEILKQTSLSKASAESRSEADSRLRSKRNGMKASVIDNSARKYIVNQGFPTIPHGVGHGIGLEVHEKPSLSPNSKNTLQNGMVFSIEPGIYEPGFGGVRIEDLVVIEHNKPKYLTNSMRELFEIS